jgi:hypothetical protein
MRRFLRVMIASIIGLLIAFAAAFPNQIVLRSSENELIIAAKISELLSTVTQKFLRSLPAAKRPEMPNNIVIKTTEPFMLSLAKSELDFNQRLAHEGLSFVDMLNGTPTHVINSRIQYFIRTSLAYMNISSKDDARDFDTWLDMVTYIRSATDPGHATENNMKISENSYVPKVELEGSFQRVQEWLGDCHSSAKKPTVFFEEIETTCKNKYIFKANVTFGYHSVGVFDIKPLNWFNLDNYNLIRKYDRKNTFPLEGEKRYGMPRRIVALCGSQFTYHSAEADMNTGEEGHYQGYTIGNMYASPKDRSLLHAGYFLQSI